MNFLREFVIFGLKQAYACVFGGALVAAIILTHFWYPFEPLHRYDFLFLFAVTVQLLLLVSGLESLREAGVIVVFHVLATVMELFKTSDSIQSWRYPGEFVIGFAHVPLFAGFMYSAVGSYIARVWRIFDFRFTHYPARMPTLIVAALIYVNFFSHHYFMDLRWLLFAIIVLLFFRTKVHFKVVSEHRYMPLLVGWVLVATFIWFAENSATFASIWLYPNQNDGWTPVSIEKIGAWFLLIILSFVLVSLVHKPQPLHDCAP